MSRVKIKIITPTTNEEYETFIYDTEDGRMLIWSVWDDFLEDWFDEDFDEQTMLKTRGQWVDFDRWTFTTGIEDHIKDHLQITEIDRDWLMEAVDCEMQETCDYNEELQGYDHTDRITKLYYNVEALCSLVDEGELLFIRQEGNFTSYIKHLIGNRIDEEGLGKVLKLYEEFRKQSDFHSFWNIYQKLTLPNVDDYIYFEYY